MTKPWYMYSVTVPFGDTNFDRLMGGAHDMDVAPPPNYPVTALLPGKVSSISAPPWGKQVGIELDTPFNGVPYMGYLHLSATNPSLSIGKRVNIGDVIGWVGGANDESQYAGTSNPTGQNFVNPPFQSSQTQVGVALMRGPEYGRAGWENFPPIDWALNPTPIIEAARKGITNVNVNYPGAINMLITDPAWVFTDSLLSVPHTDLIIVNHKTACGAMCTATQIAQGFANDTTNYKSAHFVVGRDGSVIQVVLLKDGAGANCCLQPGHSAFWDPLFAKYGNLNRCTISIEHEDWSADNSQPMTQQQIDASNKLNLWLCRTFKLTTANIHSHKSMRPGDRARCPGPTFDFNQLFAYINREGV